MKNENTDNTNKRFTYQLETMKRYHGNTCNKNMGKTNIKHLYNENIHTYFTLCMLYVYALICKSTVPATLTASNFKITVFVL